jgi:hypothetical protein
MSPQRMRSTTIRYGPGLFEAIKRASAWQGISFAQYVREAVIARIAAEWAHLRDPEEAVTISEALTKLHELAVRDFLRTQLDPELLERVERALGPRIKPPLGE